ncbi:MAG: tail fiber protein, partial [Dehalococcoidia bacterium]|nr:tail fiber protein [Dehalococcoidia bacterium]
GSCSDGKVIGEVWQFAGDFFPSGSTAAVGQLLSASQYEALFTVLGTLYGGDGVSTFGLPDLRGLAPEGVTYLICLSGPFPTPE